MRSITNNPAKSPAAIKVMGHQSVVTKFWTREVPERMTAKKQAPLSQKRSDSEKAVGFSSLPVRPAGPPKRTKLR